MNRLLSLFPRGPVLTDGAWGTELQKRGLAIGETADLWNLARPGDVEAVAHSYVEAGSQVILSNTFRSNPVSLATPGAAASVVEINRLGVELARRAAGDGVRVFGSIGPIGKSLVRGEIDARTMSDAFTIQSHALATAGADALVLETFGDLDEARLAVRAAKSTGLPIIVSFVFVTREGRDRTLRGEEPSEVGRALAEEGVDAVGANCGAGPESFPRICRQLKEAAGLPVWLKPSAGLPSTHSGRPIYAMAAEAFTAETLEMIAAGASFVGGCCGVGPEFIREMAKELMQRQRRSREAPD
jgi:methionine synthase I (cobalamin-dependent)